MSVVDVIMLLAFIAVAVVGAETVRLTCRRQLSSVPVRHQPATSVEATIRAADGS